MNTVFKRLLWLTALLTALIGAAAAGVSAQDGTAVPTPEPAQDCAECHIDVVLTWQSSTHAQAYHDTDFQAAWQAQGAGAQCLSCHTTGFVPFTSAYEQPGVTCTACHGETPANHPPEAVLVDPGVNVCANCHTTTFTEWQISAHGEQQLACTSCHTPHDQHLRFETADALCLNCHDEARDDYAHVTHVEQACVDCHWYHSTDDREHITSGNLLSTGHDGSVETVTCVACHAERSESLATPVDGMSLTSMSQAQVRISELETEIETLQAQSANQAALYLLQGLLLVALVVGLGTIAVVRYRGNGR